MAPGSEVFLAIKDVQVEEIPDFTNAKPLRSTPTASCTPNDVLTWLTRAAVGQSGGQRAVASPVLGGRPVARCRRSQQGALLVLLAQLASQTGLARRQQVQEGRVPIPPHTV
ncbi:hypothetical protein JZ751_000940 [Albula glossodonta]|uniref:Uncharacterized protein n=1 Tax=Albula glossodonta TaxID=121402 RepID=A0A8T2PY32_9TELE|nr:hypothetical protein JZ751_000940 [Albula glossodonta]